MSWESIGFQRVEGEGFYAVQRLEPDLPDDQQASFIEAFQQRHAEAHDAQVDPSREPRVVRSAYSGYLTVMSPVINVPPEFAALFTTHDRQQETH